MNLNPLALAAIRQRSGFTQTDLSNRSGVSQNHISDLENGVKGASPKTAAKIAEALGCPLGAILGSFDPEAAA